MDNKKELTEAQQKQAQIVQQVNALEVQKQRLEDQRQQLLQEALRMAGEVRLLQRQNKPELPKNTK